MPAFSPTLIVLSASCLVFALIGLRGSKIAWRVVIPIVSKASSSRAKGCRPPRRASGMKRSSSSGAVEASPGDAATHRHLAEALWNNGDQQGAITEMNRACQLEPNDARTLLRTGEMLLATGAAPAAIDRAEQVLALEHCNGEAWALRGAPTCNLAPQPERSPTSNGPWPIRRTAPR